MKITILLLFLLFSFLLQTEEIMHNKLTKEEERVIIHKGTEAPFTGEYNDFYEEGIYHCKRCGAELYHSSAKFKSGCGWPSFDDEIEGAIKKKLDADGRRTEILFVERSQEAEAYFAGGCFWGVEYYYENQFEQKDAIHSVVSGFMGGELENPSYYDVVYGKTGHREVVEISYNPEKVDYETLVRYFFEIHDPTQENGQGPDIGEQYQSVIFYQNEEEKKIAEKLIAILEEKGYKIATKLLSVSHFWKAEDYHQDYYRKTGKMPYCHSYQKKF